MKLPHLEPVRFAHEIIEHTSKKAKVKLKFPFEPTLGMLIEGAAQGSAVFSNKDFEQGFVTLLKDITLMQTPTNLELIAQLKLQSAVASFLEITFTIVDNEEQVCYAQGNIILTLQKVSQ